MEIWLVCPIKKSGGKVSIEVCNAKCKLRKHCKEYRRIVGEEIVEDLGKKTGDSSSKNPINLPEPTVQNQRALDALKRIMLIRTDIEVKFLEMGQALDEMFSNQYYIDLGYTNQKIFCEVALDMKWRTANYLRNIYLWQSELQIPEKELAEIGWSKISQILPVAKTRESAQKWIEKAKEPGMTTQTLNTTVRLARGRITVEEAEKHPETICFSVYKEQKDLIELALSAAEKATGSVSRGYLITDVICASFMADYRPEIEISDKKEIIARMLGRLEEAFNVKIKVEVTDGTTGEILVETK